MGLGPGGFVPKESLYDFGLGGNGIFSIVTCKVFAIGRVAGVVFLEDKGVCWEFDPDTLCGAIFELEELEVDVVQGGEKSEEEVGIFSNGLLMVYSCVFVFSSSISVADMSS